MLRVLSTPATALSSVPSESDPPRMCVRQFPTLSPESVSLVGFDGTGTPRIWIGIPVNEPLEQWEQDITDWLYRRFPPAIRLT
jgi:hypothetical protein